MMSVIYLEYKRNILSLSLLFYSSILEQLAINLHQKYQTNKKKEKNFKLHFFKYSN
jgi:hypothetical protein